jgi:hypothetical protein
MRGSMALLIATAATLLAWGVEAGDCVTPSAASFETPHEPSPAALCTASPPSTGEAFSGPVLQVIDGRTLCVARGPTPADWIRVTARGAPRGSTRQALMAAAFGRSLACVAVKVGSSGLEARCTVDGAPLSEVLGTDANRVDAMGWR